MLKGAPRGYSQGDRERPCHSTGGSTVERPYKPQGYPSVSAYVVADGAQGVIDFLIGSFDARQTRRYDTLDGSIMHAEVLIDDTVVMVADSGGGNPAFPTFLHVYVPDVDAAYRRALDAGGHPVDEPKQREGDPDRRGGVKDPAGNTWWIATQVG
jgi:PhnB protein